mmetsp:Transcript_13248/g.30184  ORF Transcript_13248/g.30184 Transcript_13248/m.30184 type:complete len:261 (-) Transcript_13248:618-1400(-)
MDGRREPGDGLAAVSSSTNGCRRAEEGGRPSEVIFVPKPTAIEPRGVVEEASVYHVMTRSEVSTIQRRLKAVFTRPRLYSQARIRTTASADGGNIWGRSGVLRTGALGKGAAGAAGGMGSEAVNPAGAVTCGVSWSSFFCNCSSTRRITCWTVAWICMFSPLSVWPRWVSSGWPRGVPGMPWDRAPPAGPPRAVSMSWSSFSCTCKCCMLTLCISCWTVVWMCLFSTSSVCLLSARALLVGRKWTELLEIAFMTCCSQPV